MVQKSSTINWIIKIFLLKFVALRQRNLDLEFSAVKNQPIVKMHKIFYKGVVIDGNDHVIIEKLLPNPLTKNN